ncbi:hypothetical protein GpartN1_g2918.t1 [Galdieria partita]|uniref:Golgi apparatus membrane protein TVP23 homolog n=1 Tax=Galdieria partita TaxID=83374 RepID=A0A9C7PX27_9RHOD|nr:hypothetical protein GpartN1_g2918.t1 [Galdieria partita]
MNEETTLPVSTFQVEEPENNNSSFAVAQLFSRSSHPMALFFQVAFKFVSILVYLLLGLFTSSFIIQFVITVTLVSFDFWTVKNITGRLLVGLRWWNEVQEDGSTRWRFESKEDPTYKPNKVDSRVFWWSMYLTPLLWVVLGIVCILKFHITWLVAVIIALTLSGANLIGFLKCDRESKQRLSAFVNSQSMFRSVTKLFM